MSASEGQMRDAYGRFKKTESVDCSDLDSLFEDMVSHLKDIDFKRVSINGSVDDKSLRIAFRLPDDVILSVIKSAKWEHDYVSVNILRRRTLLLSCFPTLPMLNEYMRNVQGRLDKMK